MRNEWAFELILGLAIVAAIVLVVSAVIIGVQYNKACEDRGGVPTRAGCLKPDALIPV